MVQRGMALSTGKAGRMQTACQAQASRGEGCLLEQCLLSQPLILLSACKAICLSPAEAPSTNFCLTSIPLPQPVPLAAGLPLAPSSPLHSLCKTREEWRRIVYEGTGHKGDPCPSTPQPPKKLIEPFHLSARSKPNPLRFSILHKTSPMAK